MKKEKKLEKNNTYQRMLSVISRGGCNRHPADPKRIKAGDIQGMHQNGGKVCGGRELRGRCCRV